MCVQTSFTLVAYNNSFKKSRWN